MTQFVQKAKWVARTRYVARRAMTGMLFNSIHRLLDSARPFREASVMSQAVMSIAPEVQKELDRSSYFEQRLFVWSPFGTLVTAVLIFAFFALTFVAVTKADGFAVYHTVHGFSLSDQSRGALTLSLLITVSLGLQRYSRLKDIEDCARYASALRNGAAGAMSYRNESPSGRAMVIATLAGVAFGIVAMLTFLPHPPPGTVSYVWFFAVSTLVSVLFMRGITMTRMGAESLKRFIDREVVIDLLRTDRLTIVGRSAARSALIWFAVIAVICLFFTSRDITAFTVILLLGSAGLGMAIFIAVMNHMHHRIREAKAAELERIRSRIDRLRHDAPENGDAAQRLQGLIAYETRISAAPEWPFDQTIAVRVVASALILTVPWFGQALAGTVVDRIGQMFH